MSCKTRGGTQAFWTLNKTAITASHQSAKQYYENIGIDFRETESLTNGYMYYNLTMIVPAILPMNNTDISCTVRDSSTSDVDMSNIVHLIIFGTLSKLTN